jgi:hypothetical protein
MAVSERFDKLFCGNFFGVIQERDLQTGALAGSILDPQLGNVGTLAVTPMEENLSHSEANIQSSRVGGSTGPDW